MPEPRALDVDVGPGLRLWDYGGPGPVVLLLHGYLDTGRSWDDLCGHLQGQAHCVSLDWRGHGHSRVAGPGGSYHLLDHLKDLSLLVDQLSRGEVAGLGAPALIVAHSMGGNVALLLAGSRPEVVQRLLLVDALGPPAEDPAEQPARLGRLLGALGPPRPFKVFGTRDEALERLMTTNRGISREGAERMVRHALLPAEGGWTFKLDPALRGPVPMRYPEAFWQALCGRISAITQVVRAEFGYVPDGPPATDRVAAMADGQLETMRDVGHHLHVERPQALAERVTSLLARPIAPRPSA